MFLPQILWTDRSTRTMWKRIRLVVVITILVILGVGVSLQF